MEVPNKQWYAKEVSLSNLSMHCPIAACDKCPRYYLSLKLINIVMLGALNLSNEQEEEIEKKWQYSDVFVNNDNSSGIGERKSGKISAVDGFCPEITARYLDLYCSTLKSFSDEDHKTVSCRMLKEQAVDEKDPRYLWSIVIPCHYTECCEYPIYS